MSGGTFDYSQYYLNTIADTIQSVIDRNDDASLNEYGEPIGRGYSAKTIKEFRKAVISLKRAEIYAHRIDWLLAGDDGEDTFHQRLALSLKPLDQE